MTTLIKKKTWEAYGASVQGASHKRVGLPNQDALKWEMTSSMEGNLAILAVADGHGNAKSFRSELGSKLAVKVATETLRAFANAFAGQTNLAGVERAMETDLPRQIVQRWQVLAEEHRKDNPFSDRELDALDPLDRKTVEETPLVAYGATLLAVLLTESFIAFLQLGDGDILAVSEKGEVSRPLPRDDRLIANETTSLCSVGSKGNQHHIAGQPGAWVEFRTRLQPMGIVPPALLLVSTDGYANSFQSDMDFLQVGSDLLEILRSKGLDHVKANLDTWLTAASQAGSGDDVTLAVIHRTSNGQPDSLADWQSKDAVCPGGALAKGSFSRSRLWMKILLITFVIGATAIAGSWWFGLIE